ncbi:hypothetical protein PWT90_04829 [Aphanocladium album]|nr:hypothetical protein PWT90_04829 [Aphanocladium album]
MESINKINYKVGDVPTRSVVLFPGRAQVFRDIKDVELKPGINEVTITGLSPTLDENSVKVEGTGSAVITDISVESLPNRDSFEDVYPDEDLSDESDSDDEEVDPPALLELQERDQALVDNIDAINDAVAGMDKRLAILDRRSDPPELARRDKSVATSADMDGLSDLLTTYKLEREALWEERQGATTETRRLWKELDAVRVQISKLRRAMRKESREKTKAKQKERERRERRRVDRREEKERIKAERVKFWPRHCYAITVTLDVNTMTPMSSRRQSVASEVDVVKAVGIRSDDLEEDAVQDCIACNLCVSYVTSAANWTPSYDLQLSTTGASATLCFDAKISNETSETWKNCKVSLSTSDAALSGIDSALPELSPWRIRLAGKQSVYGDADEQITRSRQETSEYNTFLFAQKRRTVAQQKSRSEMFGISYIATPFGGVAEAACAGEEFEIEDDDCLFDMGSADMAKSKKKLSSGARSRVMRRSAAAPPRPMVAMAAPMAAAPPPPPPGGRGGGGGAYGASAPAPAAYAEPEVVDFEDSFVEEAGMTTNYDLPGLKTLAPKSASSKQRVARITFSSVTLSHSVVAKYRPVAYLQAKLKNNSKLTLLKGPAGLTLDGSFMGHTAIPRCHPGDVFTLNLGVDPAIKVSYPKPEVRRATTGLFSKENSSVFARAVVLHNTRAGAGKPAQLHVLDQVPVSEDERLRVDVVTPRGLAVDGGAVVAGAPGREENQRDREWGKATALMKKGGEVSWDVKLNAGKMVKLWLEYAVSAPSGDVAVEC